MNKNVMVAKQLIKLAKQVIFSQGILSQENLFNELKKIQIEEYQPFKKVHNGIWISYPVNRNANLPDIYVVFNDEKLYCGYNYISEEEQDYQGAVQESIIGLLQELAIIEENINKIVVELKNEELDKKNKQQKEESDDEQEDEENTDDEQENEENSDDEQDLNLDL